MIEFFYPYDLKEAAGFFLEEHPSFPIHQVCGEADGIVFKGDWEIYKYFYEDREFRQIL